jgi:hypothetical protein
LQMGSQKLQNIREASAPGTSGENSSSVKFDSLDPSRLALRADLRSLHLMPAPALDCGQNSMTLDSGCSSLDSASLANAGDLRSESSGIFEGPSATSLVSGTTKTPPDRAPGVPASDSSFRVVREFRGKKSEESKQVPCSATGQRALRAPYFMHPSVYHRGLHKSRSPITALATRHSAEGASASHQPPVTSYPPQRHRRFRIGFFGTRDREFYTKHYHFPGMNRFEILEVFLQKFGQRMKPLRGFPRDWDPCEIAVSIDGRGGDRKGKSFLSQDHYFAALRECDFVLSPPGWCMPLSHNLIEAVFCGAIPITNGGAFMAEPLADGLNCLEFEDAVGLVSVIERALAMDADEVERMRRAVLEYYDRFLEPKASGEKLLRSESARVLVNAEENSVPLVFAGMVFPWDVPPDTMQT